MHKDVDYKAFKSCKVGFLFRPTSYLRYLEINWCKIMYCLLETILKDRSLSSVSNNLYWGHSHEHTVAWCMNLLLQCWGPLLSQIMCFANLCSKSVARLLILLIVEYFSNLKVKKPFEYTEKGDLKAETAD